MPIICLAAAHHLPLLQHIICLAAAHHLPCCSTSSALLQHIICLAAAHHLPCCSTSSALLQHIICLAAASRAFSKTVACLPKVQPLSGYKKGSIGYPFHVKANTQAPARPHCCRTTATRHAPYGSLLAHLPTSYPQCLQQGLQ